MKKPLTILFLLIIPSLLFSQNKQSIDFDAIDAPSAFSKSHSMVRSSFPPALNKLKDPSITGGKISDVTQHWPLIDNVNANELPISEPVSLVF